MRWENETSRGHIIDSLDSMDIIYDAYREGYINYDTYRTAMGKITTNSNGDWMFENGRKHLFGIKGNF